MTDRRKAYFTEYERKRKLAWSQLNFKPVTPEEIAIAGALQFAGEFRVSLDANQSAITISNYDIPTRN